MHYANTWVTYTKRYYGKCANRPQEGGGRGDKKGDGSAPYTAQMINKVLPLLGRTTDAMRPVLHGPETPNAPQAK